jgi:uncharacterized membrane protein
MINNNFTGIFHQRRVDKSNRPTVRPEMTPIDWLLEAVAAIGLMTLFGFAIYYYAKLPETIPSHFNGAGQPDEYSAKATFWTLPGIGVFIYALMSLIVLVPHKFNFTVQITPTNALKQYAMAINLIRYLKAAIIWLFFYISYSTIRVAAGADSGLGAWFLPVVLGGILGPVIIYVIMAYRQKN